MTLILLIFAITVFVERVAASSPPHASSGPHIADVNLLLPPKMTFPVQYRLQGSDGCFKWFISISISISIDCFLLVHEEFVDRFNVISI